MTQAPSRPSFREGVVSDRAAGDAALARCLEPYDAEDFFATYWEQKPLVVPRSEPGRFDDLLSETDVERLVCSGALRHPAFRVVKAGAQIPLSDYTVDVPWRPVSFSGSAQVDRVLAEFRAGATIVLQALHLNWPPLARFCRALEAALGHPVQANAYYTPRDSQGLGVHHDTHDVVCLQVAGEKRWLVFDPVFELPLRDQRYRTEMGEPGTPTADVVLRPGDTLYLPRGWLHEALTSASDSLHLTIGVNVATWLDAFRAALEACAADLEFRRSIPDDGVMSVELVDRLRERLAPEEVARRRRRSFVGSRRPVPERRLAELRDLDTLAPDTPLERRPSVIAELELEGDVPVLRFERKTIVFPPYARREVLYAATADEPFQAAELPGVLDDAGKLVLVRRLVREGFLRTSRRSGADVSD